MKFGALGSLDGRMGSDLRPELGTLPPSPNKSPCVFQELSLLCSHPVHLLQVQGLFRRAGGEREWVFPAVWSRPSYQRQVGPWLTLGRGEISLHAHRTVTGNSVSRHGDLWPPRTGASGHQAPTKQISASPSCGEEQGKGGRDFTALQNERLGVAPSVDLRGQASLLSPSHGDEACGFAFGGLLQCTPWGIG